MGSVKLQNLLIKIFTWSLFWAGAVWLFIEEYWKTPGIAMTVKIGLPVLVAFFIVWTKYYGAWQQGVERKLIAIATAGELGKIGTTGPVMANVLDQMGLVVPILTMALIYIIGGMFLYQTGVLLLELLALYMLPVIGKIVRDKNSREWALREEAKKNDAIADAVANKIANQVREKSQQ